MRRYPSEEKMSKREQLLDKIRKSKTKKDKFILWLEQYDLLFKKSESWDSIINELSKKRKPTNKELFEYFKSIRIEAREKKAKKESDDGTKYKKGHEFEKKVARWAKRYFGADEVKTNIYVNGITKRPYEVDVYVRRRVGFLGRRVENIWVECKNRKASIKRTDIFKLVESARDVNKAYDAGREDEYFDRLIFVSVSRFDVDALSYAKEKDIACFHYKNNKYELENNVNWI